MYNEHKKFIGDNHAEKAHKEIKSGNGCALISEKVFAGNRCAALATRYAEVGDQSICMAKRIKIGKNSVGVVLDQTLKPILIVSSAKIPVMTPQAYEQLLQDNKISIVKKSDIIHFVDDYMSVKSFK